jgi:hypothetical protein
MDADDAENAQMTLKKERKRPFKKDVPALWQFSAKSAKSAKSAFPSVSRQGCFPATSRDSADPSLRSG